jgi:osmotically-inducible protein OsmY
MYPDLRLSDEIEQKLSSDRGTDRRTIGDGGAALRDRSGAPCADDDEGSATDSGGASSLSDSHLLQLALPALERDALVPAEKVRVVIRNGWLILDGAVEARIQRQAAEDAVKALPGIRGVSNNILIESEVMAQRVSRKIDEALVRNARLSASRISVSASNHKVILCGSVHSRTEREEAEAAAWAVPGVGHVVNRIRAPGGEG